MKSVQFTPEMDACWLELRQRGYGWQVIADRVGVDANVLLKHVRALGFDTRINPLKAWTPERDAIIDSLRAKGQSWEAIAFSLKIPRTSVRRRARALGFDTSTRRTYTRCPQPGQPPTS